MQAISIQTDPTLVRDNPTGLFTVSGLRAGRSGQPAFDVSADGRILFSAQEGLATAGDAFDDFRRVNVVVNWFQELLARVPVD